MRRIILFIVLLAVAAPAVRAGGMSYSLYGLGEPDQSANGRSAGLGGIWAGLRGAGPLNVDNPSSWGDAQVTEFQGTFRYMYVNTQSTTDRVLFGKLDMYGAAMFVPLDRANGVTLGLGVRPVTSVEYNFTNGVERVNDTVSYVSTYTGSGGMSSLFLGASYRVVPWLTLGVDGEYVFGSITRSVEALFNASSEYTRTGVDHRISPDAFTARIGAQVASGNFTAAGAVRLPTTLRAADVATYETSVLGVTDTAISIWYDQTLPLMFGVGVSYRLQDMLFAAQYAGEQWGSFKDNGVHPAELRNASTLSMGVERLPDREASGVGKWAFRVGGAFRALPYTVSGHDLTEMLLTAGAGIPIGGATGLDVALQYGVHGTTDSGLLKESVFRTIVTIRLNEPWYHETE